MTAEDEAPLARRAWRGVVERWRSWRRGSVVQRILAVAATVAGLSILVKLVSAGKEVVVAYQYGVGDALDAYLIAFVIPSFAVNVVGGSVPAALIPTYVELQEERGFREADRFLSSLTGLFLLGFAAVILLLALVGPYLLPFLGSGFGSDKLALTESLFFLLLPVILVGGLATIWSSVLNAGDRFALAALAPAGPPLLAAAFVLAFADRWGIYALAGGTLAGFVLQMALLGIGLRRRDHEVRLRLPRLDGPTRKVLGQYGPMVVGALLMSGTMVIDRSMAAMLGSGSVSSLNYGNKIAAFAAGLGSTALGTAVLPYFSRMVARSQYEKVRSTLVTYGWWVLAAAVPLTVLLVAASEPVVRLIFERGAFTPADTLVVTRVQQLYLLQVPFYVLGILFVRFISSVQRNEILMWGAVITLALDVILNLVFMRWLGVAGIALSTAVCYLVSCLYLGTMTSRQLGRLSRA